MLQSNPGCVCVCLSVCASVCVISTAQTNEPILMKLYTNDLEYICECHFSRFLKFRIWWRHSGHFALTRCGTLTVAILVRFSSNFNTRSTSNSCIVWYWKSARSINNFRSKKRTAFESHRCFGFRAELWGRGFESQRGQIFFLWLWMFLVTLSGLPCLFESLNNIFKAIINYLWI